MQQIIDLLLKRRLIRKNLYYLSFNIVVLVIELYPVCHCMMLSHILCPVLFTGNR